MFLILGRELRKIKEVIYRNYSSNIEDLNLKEIIIVEGFYINIISEAYLREKGV